MAEGAGMKASLQVPPTNTIVYMRTRLVRAIAWRSIHSRHLRARDGRLEYVTRANEIEPAARSQTNRPPEGRAAGSRRRVFVWAKALVDAAMPPITRGLFRAREI
jgi:hypothetical protein